MPFVRPLISKGKNLVIACMDFAFIVVYGKCCRWKKSKRAGIML
jgi:hypothetical protein